RQLQGDDDPEEAQKEALERLEEAQERLAKAQEQAEEELAREQLAKIADHIKSLKERQDAATQESASLHQRMLQQSRWTRGLLDSLSKHGGTQADLGKETENLKEKLAGAKVFAHILQRAADSMGQASKRIDKRLEIAK